MYNKKIVAHRDESTNGNHFSWEHADVLADVSLPEFRLLMRRFVLVFTARNDRGPKLTGLREILLDLINEGKIPPFIRNWLKVSYQLESPCFSNSDKEVKIKNLPENSFLIVQIDGECKLYFNCGGKIESLFQHKDFDIRKSIRNMCVLIKKRYNKKIISNRDESTNGTSISWEQSQLDISLCAGLNIIKEAYISFDKTEDFYQINHYGYSTAYPKLSFNLDSILSIIKGRPKLETINALKVSFVLGLKLNAYALEFNSKEAEKAFKKEYSTDLPINSKILVLFPDGRIEIAKGEEKKPGRGRRHKGGLAISMPKDLKDIDFSDLFNIVDLNKPEFFDTYYLLLGRSTHVLTADRKLNKTFVSNMVALKRFIVDPSLPVAIRNSLKISYALTVGHMINPDLSKVHHTSDVWGNIGPLPLNSFYCIFYSDGTAKLVYNNSGHRQRVDFDGSIECLHLALTTLFPKIVDEPQPVQPLTPRPINLNDPLYGKLFASSQFQIYHRVYGKENDKFLTVKVQQIPMQVFR